METPIQAKNRFFNLKKQTFRTKIFDLPPFLA